MPYLVNIYFQGKLVAESSRVTASKTDATIYSLNFITNKVKKYPTENQLWAESCYFYVITPEEETLLPNYNL